MPNSAGASLGTQDDAGSDRVTDHETDDRPQAAAQHPCPTCTGALAQSGDSTLMTGSEPKSVEQSPPRGHAVELCF